MLAFNHQTWQAVDAVKLGLCDSISTSDEVLRAACRTGEVLAISHRGKKSTGVASLFQVMAQAALSQLSAGAGGLLASGIVSPPGGMYISTKAAALGLSQADADRHPRILK